MIATWFQQVQRQPVWPMEAGLAGSGTSLSSYSGIKIEIFDPPINITRIKGTKACFLFIGCIGIDSLLSTKSNNHAGSINVHSKQKDIWLPELQQPGKASLGHWVWGSWQHEAPKMETVEMRQSSKEHWHGNEAERKKEGGVGQALS